MGFTSICMAFSSIGGNGSFGFGGYGFEIEEIETAPETAEEEEIIAEVESETEPMEEEKDTDEG